MESLIHSLQSLPPIILTLISFIFAYGAVLLFGYIAGKKGLYTILVLLIIAANIQVLKVVKYGFFSDPVALGTELFAATYLATDILSEIYSKKAAMGGIILGFLAMIFWVVFAIITLGFKPVTLSEIGGNTFLFEIHHNLSMILTPAPAILFASIFAFLVSQTLDVYVFSYIKKKTGDKFLWLRNNLSTMLSALIDNIIFSSFAWVIFSNNPVGMQTLIKTYILGTYGFRIVAAILDTPIMYIAKKIIEPAKTHLSKYQNL